MVKKYQEHAEIDSNQARMTCYFMKYTRLVYEIYTTSALGMHGVTKPSKNSGMPQQNNHKYILRYGQHKLNKHAHT